MLGKFVKKPVRSFGQRRVRLSLPQYLVMVMVILMGIFFFIVDWALATIIKLFLGLGGLHNGS